ncbi:MAG: hypothetical protein AB7S78_00070 [Candidatus Omnitrophota bacterium]
MINRPFLFLCPMRSFVKKQFPLTLFFCVWFQLGTLAPCASEKETSRITDEVIPQVENIPQPPALILEIGDKLLQTGPIQQGFEIPTGAVWQPSFLMWGNYRTAVQTFYNGQDDVSEWVNRFDLYGNLYFTRTERILAGVRFLDRNGEFTGYTFSSPGQDDQYNDATNFYVSTLFFEGDFGELFPNLDPTDSKGLDYGLAIGRQPINFQQGMLINDNIDAVGISKINLKPDETVNLRSTFVWGANELNRNNLSSNEKSSQLFGLFNEADYRTSTLELDAVYVSANDAAGDGFFAGLGTIQRIGKYNTTFRVLGSAPIHQETEHNSAGLLLFSEISFSPTGSHNHIYLTGFRAFDHFRSASRDPLAGGPLGQTGILFEAVGLGRYSAPLSNAADDAFGGSLGYQMFFKEARRQLILELSGRYSTEDEGQRAIGPGLRYQMAVGQRGVVRMDSFILYDQNRDSDPPDRDEYKSGGRVEFQWKF